MSLFDYPRINFKGIIELNPGTANNDDYAQLPSAVAVVANAQAILDRIDPQLWMFKKFMPRTRDMSDSRRTLLQAWCRKVLSTPMQS